MLTLRRARRPLAIVCIAVVALAVFAPGAAALIVAPPPLGGSFDPPDHGGLKAALYVAAGLQTCQGGAMNTTRVRNEFTWRDVLARALNSSRARCRHWPGAARTS